MPLLTMWRRFQKFSSTFVPGINLAVYLLVVICLLNRWDSTVAITVIPFWAWAAVGMLVAVISWVLFRGVGSIGVFVLWLATTLVFSEESRGTVRELIHSIDPPPELPEEETIRIVNVNAGGTEAALRRVIELDPDVIIVQEAPSEAEVIAVANELFDVNRAIITSDSLAILARGELLDSIEPENETILHARIGLLNGQLIDISNVVLKRLLPRYDLWKPETWNQLTETRKSNRRLLRNALGENQIDGVSIGRIVAGGFYTPPGDDTYRPLESNLMIDVFRSSGEGWGNTWPGDHAALRIDQIWVSDQFQPERSRSQLNPQADHRIVVSDVRLPLQES